MKQRITASTIQVALLEFEELDRRLPERMRAGEFDFLEKVRAAKNRIKDLATDDASLQFTGRLQTALRRVRANEGYNIDRLYELYGPDSSQEADDRDFVDALFTEGTAVYVDQSFYRRRRQVGAVVVSQNLPIYVQQRLRNVSTCYSLGLFQATVVFCRALVDAAIFEALKRRGRIVSRGKIVDQAEYKPAELRQRVREFVPSRLWDRTCGPNGVTKLADHVLHTKDDVCLGEKETYDSIKASFALVEQLFG